MSTYGFIMCIIASYIDISKCEDAHYGFIYRLVVRLAQYGFHMSTCDSYCAVWFHMLTFESYCAAWFHMSTYDLYCTIWRHILTYGLRTHAVMKMALGSHRRKSTEYWKMIDKELCQRISWSINGKYKSYSLNSISCSLNLYK